VHRIPLAIPDVLHAINVYAIEDADGLVLIDSGWDLGPTRDQLAEGLHTAGYVLQDVRRFLITHIHRDHYTLAVRLRRELGIPIALGAGEQPSLRVASAAESLPYTAQLEALRRHDAADVADRVSSALTEEFLDPAIWEPPDEWLEDGAVLELKDRSLHVVHTPGHTQGHVVFHDPHNGLLFAGDTVLPHITPSISFEPAPGPLALDDYLRSLRRVRALPEARLLPAHGPVRPGTHARVDELLMHHDTRLAASKQTVIAGAQTAYAAAQSLNWTRHQRRFDELKPFHQMLAVIETAAHLDVLVARGELHSTEHERVVSFTTPERV
jgi:glyoxylase-like metal-dependent hydrolase (beta-lactamase superfamily II)